MVCGSLAAGFALCAVVGWQCLACDDQVLVGTDHVRSLALLAAQHEQGADAQDQHAAANGPRQDGLLLGGG